MSVHKIQNPTISQADKALQIDKGHLWLHCFRTCAVCKTLSPHLTQYEFGDGSSVVLDSSGEFPEPVRPELLIRHIPFNQAASH